MRTNCYSCSDPIDTESATAIHVRDRDGAFVLTIYVCNAEYACYDAAAACIKADGEHIGHPPSLRARGV